MELTPWSLQATARFWHSEGRLLTKQGPLCPGGPFPNPCLSQITSQKLPETGSHNRSWLFRSENLGIMSLEKPVSSHEPSPATSPCSPARPRLCLSHAAINGLDSKPRDVPSAPTRPPVTFTPPNGEKLLLAPPGKAGGLPACASHRWGPDLQSWGLSMASFLPVPGRRAGKRLT